MLDPKASTIVGGELNCFLSVISDSFINRDCRNSSPRKPRRQFFQDHQKSKAILSPGHCNSNVVLRREHFPAADCPSNLLLNRPSETRLAKVHTFVFSPIEGLIVLTNAANEHLHLA